ncbi:MAG: hypothetical protein WBW76_05610 [Candidatus Cybelea sp.]
MIRLRFRRNALAVTAIAAALAASSIFRASGNQPEEASAAITPSGELLRLGSGSLSLPPSNGPGATPSGIVTAKLSPTPPAGRTSVSHALAYFAIGSDATIDITGALVVSLKPPSGSRCTGNQTDIASLGASGWISWQKDFLSGEFGCDAAGNITATLTPQGRLRIAPGAAVVLAVFKAPASAPAAGF